MEIYIVLYSKDCKVLKVEHIDLTKVLIHLLCTTCICIALN